MNAAALDLAVVIVVCHMDKVPVDELLEILLGGVLQCLADFLLDKALRDPQTD